MNQATGPAPAGASGGVILGADASVLAADEVACALLGIGAAAAVGRPWTALLPASERPQALDALRAAQAGQTWRGTIRLAVSGVPAMLNMDVVPVETGGGIALLRLTASPPAFVEAANEAAEVRAQRDALEALRLLTDPSAAAHALLQAAHSVVAFDWSVVLRFDPAGSGSAGEELTRAAVLSVYPAPMAGVSPGTGWGPLDPPEAGVQASGAPALSGDITIPSPEDGGHSPLARLGRFGMRSRLHLPLYSASRVAGCVILFSEVPYALGIAEGMRVERILRPLGELLDRDAEGTPAAAVVDPTASATAVPPPETEGLNALSELVSGVAHELNNPLTSILGYAQIFNSLSGAERDHALVTIEAEAQRAARIVRNLLSFARQGTRTATPVNLEAVLQRVVDIRRYSLEVDNVHVSLNFGGVPPLLADESLFEEVFLNLITNAQQALHPRGGEIAITTSLLDGNVRISIADNGPGVPEEMRGRIFEPFFTTRDVGAGAGMGLSTVFGVVTEHGGRVWMEPTSAGGANFIIELPVQTDRAAAPPTVAPRYADRALRGAGERILVADDERHIRALASEILTSAGYAVTTAANGAEALQCMEEADFDLVVTDMRMPGMDGTELHARVCARWPQLQRRMIFVTGDIDGERTGRRLAQGDVRYLEKPFETAALLRTIREVLDADPQPVG